MERRLRPLGHPGSRLLALAVARMDSCRGLRDGRPAHRRDALGGAQPATVRAAPIDRVTYSSSVTVFAVADKLTGEGAVLRPGPGRALVIALGVAAWVPFVFLVLGLALTDGSYWSLLFALAGVGAAWMRARAAWRDGDTFVVRNFHSRAIVALKPASVLRPSTHWAQPNFDCLAIHTPGEQMCQVHATATAQRQRRRDQEAGRVEQVLGIPSSHKRIGTWRQLRRRL